MKVLHKPYKISKRLLFIFGVLVVFGLLELALITLKLNQQQPTTTKQNSSRNQSAATQQDAKRDFDKTRYSLNEASSIWIVVNKGRILPRNYAPTNLMVPEVSLRGGPSSSNMHLRSEAAQALEKLFADAAGKNLKLRLVSGYRSYATQTSVYNGYVRSDGKEAADDFSARPGHSEHQTGLAADVAPLSMKCSLQQCFADTPEGEWLEANAHQFGFIIRYPKGLRNLTGYEYEPWHIRYVGKGLAEQLKQSGQTMEQFFGLASYPNYPNVIYKLK